MTSWTVHETDLTVLRGNLAEIPADATVVAVRPNGTSAGPSSGAILQRAGESVQEELEHRGNLRPGEPTRVSAGNLPSSTLLAVALSDCGSVDDPARFLEDAFRNLYRLAGEDEAVDRLAMQPLGSGDFEYSLREVSRAAVEAIPRDSSSLSGLSEIQLVVYDVVDHSAVENFVEQAREGSLRDSGPEPRDFT